MPAHVVGKPVFSTLLYVVYINSLFLQPIALLARYSHARQQPLHASETTKCYKVRKAFADDDSMGPGVMFHPDCRALRK